MLRCGTLKSLAASEMHAGGGSNEDNALDGWMDRKAAGSLGRSSPPGGAENTGGSQGSGTLLLPDQCSLALRFQCRRGCHNNPGGAGKSGNIQSETTTV